jgi:hypothetical protein
MAHHPDSWSELEDPEKNHTPSVRSYDPDDKAPEGAAGAVFQRHSLCYNSTSSQLLPSEAMERRAWEGAL